jgi:hypothetical protein
VTGNKWTAIAAKLPGRSALCVKNRWNWLMRHQGIRSAEEVPEARPQQSKQSQILFDSLTFDDGLFEIGFKQFQAKMFGRIHL